MALTTAKPTGPVEMPGHESPRELAKRSALPPAMIQTMQGLMPAIPDLLPPDISTEQFRAALYLELSGRRELADCTQDSLRDCVIKAAMHGLLPGRDCHLLPFRTRGAGGRKTATYVPNYFGVILALERTGKVAKAFAHPVYAGDEFVIDYLADVYKHIPAVALGKAPGTLRFFYGCVRMKDGTTHIEVMDEAAIDAVRRRSPAHEHGPWVEDYLMMARKTALKRVAKYVRLTPEQAAFLSEDEAREQEDIPAARHQQNIVDLFGDDPHGSTPTHARPVMDLEREESRATTSGVPAGAQGGEYVAQLEAILLRQGSDLPTFWRWAEKQKRKPQAQFTEADYADLLQRVQAEAKRRATEAPTIDEVETSASKMSVETSETKESNLPASRASDGHRDAETDDTWRGRLVGLLEGLQDATLAQEAQSMLEDADVTDDAGQAFVLRVLNALDAQDADTSAAF